MTKKSEPKLVLPGRQMDFGEQKVRVLDGNVRVPSQLPMELLAETPGLVAWVGRKTEEGRILDALPVFTAREHGRTLTAVQAGIVLLTDLTRDAAAENRFSPDNFTLGNYDQLEEHIFNTYGALTATYMRDEYLHQRLGRKDSHRFIAKRMARVLRANYALEAKDLVADKGRLTLTRPPTTLTRFESTESFKSLAGFAKWLGLRFLEADHRLLLKRPKLADRSHLFVVTDEPVDPTPEADAA